MNAKQILDREYLLIRAKLLEIAASMDRMDRAEGDTSEEEQLLQLKKGLEILLSEDPNRAEQVQLLFSNPYAKDWQDKYDFSPRF